MNPPARSLYTINGLSNGANYTVRVIAVNTQGASIPSNEHFGRPQKEWLEITRNTVDRNTITLRYQRELDANFVPDPDRFWVGVNGGLRAVTSTSVSGRNVILTLESEVNSADEVVVNYYAPSEVGVKGIQDTEGQTAPSLWFPEPLRLSDNKTPGPAPNLTAEFVHTSEVPLPLSHDGPSAAIRIQISFSEPVRVEAGPAFAYLLEVEGAEVVFAWWVDRDTSLWEISWCPKTTIQTLRSCCPPAGPVATGERLVPAEREH